MSLIKNVNIFEKKDNFVFFNFISEFESKFSMVIFVYCDNAIVSEILKLRMQSIFQFCIRSYYLTYMSGIYVVFQINSLNLAKEFFMLHFDWSVFEGLVMVNNYFLNCSFSLLRNLIFQSFAVNDFYIMYIYSIYYFLVLIHRSILQLIFYFISY